MNAKLDAAIAYAGHGWPVFVLSRSKVPVKLCGSEECEKHRGNATASEVCECLTCHGFYAATRDQARITEMLRLYPDGCLAIRTGAPSGLVVVDVDIKTWTDDFWPDPSDDAYQTMSKLDEAGVLPGTVTQISGSGGLHLLYTHPGGWIKSGAGLIGPRVDCKADGGYFIVAPSVHPRTGKAYQWSGDGRWDYDLPPLHPALTERLEHKPTPVAYLDKALLKRPASPRGRLGGLLDAVIQTPPDTKRNDMLFWAAKKAGEMIADGEISEDLVVQALQQAGQAAGLTASEIGDANKGTIGSGLRHSRRLV